MNILIVGAGAVGQVYGRHLAAGGARVTFLIREKYRAALEDGMTIYPLNEGGKNAQPFKFRRFELATSNDALENETWDQVWLCVSSTALRKTWLGDLMKRVGKATVVALQPGLEDRAFLLAYVHEQRLVNGLISLISFPTPLPGGPRSDRLPGMAYWVPPFAAQPFSGPAERRDQVIDALGAGGMRATKAAEVSRLSAFPAAMLMSLMLCLEGAGWSFACFRKGHRLSEAVAVMREALVIAARHHQVRPPWWRWLLSSLLLRTALVVAPRLIPLPLEPYFRFHFQKVGDQTQLYIQTYLTKGRLLGVKTEVMARMSAQVFPKPTP